ncbi:histidine kinase [Kribbella flavida DSM 17836]|uniref:histidine kinase n=1 Tax=Kribbella flavida (strain DSM 17836 / JCM 10339 / NBRC 14399) TaxID=479435 RepID=D2PV37_KRIFD|nr:histidine kinase [Kribbella flavida DSM 17836]
MRNWLLPVLLAAGYVAVFHAIVAAEEAQLSRAEYAAADAATVVAAAALGFRRRAPVVTLCVVTLVTVLGQLATSPDSVGPLPAETVALYSVAVRCRGAITWRAVTVLIVVQSVVAFGVFGREDLVVSAVSNLIVYACIGGLGGKRRRGKARRAEAVRRAQAIAERARDAAAIERRRLARDLHDVSAHHLTSIVVSSSAAQRLSDRQPELAGEALTFAAKTGRETLTALRRLVAVLETGEREQAEPPAGRIAELARAFERLGQQVRVDIDPEFSGPAAGAVFGIVRESLTNTLRYAPGAAVRVDVRREGDWIVVLVENGRGAAIPIIRQGSGRGVAGMTERAAAAGGTLTAGPGPDGGWRVRATVRGDSGPAAPEPSSAQMPPFRPPPPVGARLKRWAIDTGIALAAVVPPADAVLTALADERPADRAAVTSLGLLLTLIPGLALLGRRDRPWGTLGGVVAAGWLWPVLMGPGVLPATFDLGALFVVGAHAAAVYAVGLYGGPSRRTWLSAVISAGGFGVAMGAIEVVAPLEGEPGDVGYGVFLSVLVALAVLVPLLGCWAAGRAVRRRRYSGLDDADEALSEEVRAAVAAVHTERQRVAAGLHDSVLTRTSRMIGLAEAGCLDGVITEARAALMAMRELLDSLYDSSAPAPLSPHLTGRTS